MARGEPDKEALFACEVGRGDPSSAKKPIEI